MTFGVNLTSATQFGASFATTEISQDGYGSGRLSGFTADDSGVLVARYSNGETRPQGQIVLANFANPQGLISLGGNLWVEGATAGQPTLGAPGSGVMGTLESSAVENSNVDLTSELVAMITAQRVYQANAQTIKTHDQLLQTIVNLR
jgi:flagellar hook protein FlgE